MKFGKLLAALAVGMLIGISPVAVPTAAASPTCEHRSDKHVAEHGGIKADRAWHIAHGDRPTCEAETSTRPVPKAPEHEDNGDRDKKSRYCRGHWYC